MLFVLLIYNLSGCVSGFPRLVTTERCSGIPEHDAFAQSAACNAFSIGAKRNTHYAEISTERQ